MHTSYKRILITGAGSGLGRGLAVEMASCGHRVLLMDRNKAGLDETVKLLPNRESLLISAVVDITSSDAVAAFADEWGGKCDVLINNAGLQHVAGVDEFPIERWDTLIDVMLRGPFLLTRALLPSMRRQNFGRIINIGSIHSLVASPFKSAYVTAKHGLVGFSKTVALETAGVDITINTICPAYIRTPLVDSQIEAQARANGMSVDDVINKVMLEPMPKKTFITVDEVVGTIEFLISSSARNITAQTIAIDGGWTAR